MSTEAEIESKFREAVKGKPYRPSNGTEGLMFISGYCDRCVHDRLARDPDHDPSEGCKLLANSFAFNIGDPEYPKEWKYDDSGFPICTAFRDEELGEPRDENAAVGDLFITEHGS